MAPLGPPTHEQPSWLNGGLRKPANDPETEHVRREGREDATCRGGGCSCMCVVKGQTCGGGGVLNTNTSLALLGCHTGLVSNHK